MASSLTTPAPFARCISSTASTPTTPSSWAMVSASRWASTACVSVSPGAGVTVSTQIPRRWTDSVTGYAAACPDGEPVPHDRLVLRMYQGCGSRAHHHPGGLQVAEQSGGHVLMVEGDDVAAGREGTDGLRVGVVTDGHVPDHGGRRH